MSDLSRTSEIVGGFRRLRPAVHDWLARDLDGPPLDYTRAYADLMFAYAFARLGSAGDARELARTATETLSGSANEAHVFLCRMFHFRIHEALAGLPNSGMFPEDVGPPRLNLSGSNRRLQLEISIAERLSANFRILDPFGAIDPYAEWTKRIDSVTREVEQLRRLSEPEAIVAAVRRLLDQAVGSAPLTRAGVWAKVVPCVARAGHEFMSRLLLDVSGVIHEAVGVPFGHPSEIRGPLELAAFALDRAAAMPDPEFFPPLADAGVAVIRKATGQESRLRGLTEIGWAALHWFRRLGDRDEASAFRHATRDYWPTPAVWRVRPGRLGDVGEYSLAATTALAGFRLFVGEPDPEDSLSEVAGILATHRVSPPGLRTSLGGLASALAFRSPTEAFDRTADLLGKLQRISNTWTSAQWCSRTHLILLDGLVLAFPEVRGV